MLAVANPGEAGEKVRPARRARMSGLYELTKPGITRLVLLTTGVGFYLASEGALDFALLLHTLVGTALAASGTNALNQYVERDIDAKMARTRNRPLPSGRLRPGEAAAFATMLSAVGIAYLWTQVNTATALVVLASLISYVAVYTPLKRVTSISTLIGAVPGALPVVAGWTAAGRGVEEPGAWALFLILFFWQIPHFLALAWIYRDEYRAGGLAMLTVEDPGGARTGFQVFNYAVALVPASLLPYLLGLAGDLYFVGALALGGTFLALSTGLLIQRTDRRAWRLFFASVVYLPVLLLIMVANKIP